MRVTALPAFSTKEFNPYNWLLYTNVQAAGQRVIEFSWRHVIKLQVPDVFHVHWPEWYALTPGWNWRKSVDFVLFHLYLRLIRMCGGKVVWTAHNAFAHDRAQTRLDVSLWKSFLARVDGIIYLSWESKRQIEGRYPVLAQKQWTVIQHGDYVDWIAEASAAARRDLPSRESLGIPARAKVILAFGRIRPYKGIDLLIEEFRRLDSHDTHLVVAGRVPNAELEQRILELAGSAPDIHCILRRTEDDELVKLLELADIVVLPYRQITNSGSALLALSANRAILGPRMGSLPEVQQLVGEDWVRLYDGELSRAHLVEAIRWAAAPRRPLSMKPFAWPDIAKQTLGFYKSLNPHARNLTRTSIAAPDRKI
jgi:glycosyltransferase involved in cell wall biosynthesis